MLGPVLVIDPPPGSAQTQRMLAVTLVLVVGWQHPGRRPGRLTGNGQDPSVDGTRAGQLARAGLPLWGGRVQFGHWHFDLVLVLLVKLPSAEGLRTPTSPTKRLPLVGGRKTRLRTVWVGLIRKQSSSSNERPHKYGS